MKQYLTISEFAGLRGVGIGSLRYYEQLKILQPAYIDPQTKYRYYLPEQVSTLDAIAFCVEVGIPLKDMVQYLDGKGNLDHKSILEKGGRAMQEKIAMMRSALETTQFNLRSLEQNGRYGDRQGIYTREIEERFLFEAPFRGNWNDPVQRERASMALFRLAQRRNMMPVFPCGVIVHWESEPISFSFFVRVLRPDGDARTIRVPQAEFDCMQIDLVSKTDLPKILRENFTVKEHPVIISNMLLEKLRLDSLHSEIQVFKRLCAKSDGLQ